MAGKPFPDWPLASQLGSGHSVSRFNPDQVPLSVDQSNAAIVCSEQVTSAFKNLSQQFLQIPLIADLLNDPTKRFFLSILAWSWVTATHAGYIVGVLALRRYLSLVGRPTDPAYHLMMFAPQTRPAPKPTVRTVIPGLRRPYETASDRAMGMEPPLVFPYL